MLTHLIFSLLLLEALAKRKYSATTTGATTFTALPIPSPSSTVEIPYFVKNTTGSSIFCTWNWLYPLPPCYSMIGLPCLSNCTGFPYVCNTTAGPQQCDMNSCTESRSTNLNYAQSSDCTQQCYQAPCAGGTEYCNTTFLQSFYGSNLTCINTSACFCRRGTYGYNSSTILSPPVVELTFVVESYETSSCFSTYFDDVVNIMCPSNISALVRSISWNEVYLTSSNTLSIVVPTSVKGSTFDFTVVVTTDMGSTYTYSYTHFAKSVCEDIDCFFCSEKFNHFDCLTSTGKFLVILFWITIVGLAFTLIYLTLWPLFLLFWILFGFCKPFCYACYKFTSSNMRKGYRKVQEYSEEETKTVPRRSTGSVANATPVSLLVILACLPLCHSCSSTPVISSLVRTCATVNTTKTCTYNLNVLVNLALAHDSTCFTLSDEFGSPMGQVKIEYEDFYWVTTTSFQYFTSFFACTSQSKKRCYNGSPGSSGYVCTGSANGCNNMLATDNTASGMLTDPNVIYCPGMTKCDRTCGCAGCGCFECNAACTAFRWAMKPVGSIYSVYSIPSLVAFPKVKLNVTDSFNVSRVYYLNTFPGVPSTTPIGNFTQLGTFSPPVIPNLSTLGLLVPDCSGTFCNASTLPLLAHIAPRGQPLKNTVGDIQFTNRAQATCGSNTGSLNIIFDPNIGTVSGTSVTCTIPGVIYGRIIPGFYDGFAYDRFTGTSVLVRPPIFPTYQLTYQTDNLTLSQTTEQVCPSVTFINVTGCFNCPSGFRVYFFLKSNCIAGSVQVGLNGTECVPQTFLATQTGGVHFVDCQSSTKSVSLNLMVFSNTGNITFSASGTLNEPPSIDSNLNSTLTSSTGSDSSGIDLSFFGDGIMGFANSLSKWWNLFINILIILGAAIIAFYLLKLLIPIIRTTLSRRMMTTPKEKNVSISPSNAGSSNKSLQIKTVKSVTSPRLRRNH